MIQTKYQTVAKARQLEQTISWLSNYEGPVANEIHIITDRSPDHIKDESIMDHFNGEFTDALKRLGQINVERKQLIDKFTKFPG